jgi:hypothetical protein
MIVGAHYLARAWRSHLLSLVVLINKINLHEYHDDHDATTAAWAGKSSALAPQGASLASSIAFEEGNQMQEMEMLRESWGTHSG